MAVRLSNTRDEEEKFMSLISRKHPNGQRGVAAVEYAVGMMIFFSFLLGTMELARAMFVWNTTFEVTTRAARAAAMANFNDADALNALRKAAMFGRSKLILDNDISYSDLKIDYLQGDGQSVVSPLPPCPALNAANCLDNPAGSSCIQFVRVRLCRGASCSSVPYTPMTQLPLLASFNINMPYFTAIAPVESLGMPATCT
jgi:hypothetical protein